ncbi:hypothetical protein [Pedobacter cryoconitis]|uniref:Uncharacterized protein n=1 Tax=Pedobacter cryoconitis TaxID=188932 RepID=A0A327SAS6_9SPHI|nr:hypothetical protein [Pedobacter cryoconitis]RAJ22877.1 hypothetical protein LY11_04581 [Pedobacter cryoconitis]
MNNAFTLTSEIIALSESSTWEGAKREWIFTHAFQRPESACLCGKKSIINVCIITNFINDNETEVGNCCVKKFMDMDEGEAVFISLNKLKHDIESNITGVALDMFNETGKITAWEYEFYSDVMKKRKKLSPKQIKYKVAVNRKFMTYYRDKS